MKAVESSGILRAYQRQHRRSAMVSGRIDFPALVRAGGDLSRTPCVVFSRLPHTPLNRFLAATIAALRRDPLMSRAAGPSLAHLAILFADIPPAIDHALLQAKRPLTRIEQPFAGACALARLIVRGFGLNTGAEKDGFAFLINLDALFEQAVVQALVDSPVHIEANRPLPYARTGTPGVSTASAMTMFLDAYLPDVGGVAVVVDAKYKSAPSAANLQQMVTYCWMSGARTAVLVFPAGLVTDRRSYRFVEGRTGGDAIVVHVAELDVSGADLVSWQAAGRSLVDDVVRRVSSTRQD